MHFANPSAFLMLLVLALVIGLREYLWKGGRARLPFPDLRAAEHVPMTWRASVINLPSILVYVALALAIVAWARPQSLLKGEEAHARGIDIMIALDTSGSMRALDFKPLSRMDAAKNAAKTFISHRHYDRIGLIAFAGVSLMQCPLTLDYGALLDYLNDVDVGVTTTENTAIGTAIATAANHLKKSTAKSRIIILVTDGRNNSGEIDPLTAAKAAASLGIKIYTIGVGIRGQSVIPVDTVWGKQLVPIDEDLDEPALEEIARAANGRYFRATTTKEFNEIYSTIDQLEKSDIEGPSPVEYEDHYRALLLLAMAMTCAALGLQSTVLRTLP